MYQPNPSFKDDVGLKSLVSDTKMIPMDILDKLEGTLTMSKLQNIDQLIAQRPHTSNLQKKAEELAAKNKSNANRPQSSRQVWDVPSINSDINKEIDQLLFNGVGYLNPAQSNIR